MKTNIVKKLLSTATVAVLCLSLSACSGASTESTEDAQESAQEMGEAPDGGPEQGEAHDGEKPDGEKPEGERPDGAPGAGAPGNPPDGQPGGPGGEGGGFGGGSSSADIDYKGAEEITSADTRSGEITNAKGESVSTEVGKVAVSIDSTSTWNLTADTYITSFDGDASSIISNGHTLYVNGTALTGTK